MLGETTPTLTLQWIIQRVNDFTDNVVTFGWVLCIPMRKLGRKCQAGGRWYALFLSQRWLDCNLIRNEQHKRLEPDVVVSRALIKPERADIGILQHSKRSLQLTA
jgi:hypothetical protein